MSGRYDVICTFSDCFQATLSAIYGLIALKLETYTDIV